MSAATTQMSISALLNPPQQNIGTKDARQNLNLPLHKMQIDDTHNGKHRQKRGANSPSHSDHVQESSLGIDNKQQQKGSADYRYERFDSVSSTSSTAISERRRAPRPKYTDEEMYFIWYHRVDLDEDWKDCTDAFNSQFPGQGRSERNTQGIQCKFYRFIHAKKCPTVREQRRLKDGEFMARGRPSRERMPKFGVIEWCRVWYPWMKTKHAIAGLQPGPQLTPIEPNHTISSTKDAYNHNHNLATASDKRMMMRTYSHSSISSSMASVSSSEQSTPEPYTPSSYSEEIVSEEEEEEMGY
ncbi:hypothetical protein UA08_03594 [Talaromyces atroroseus]|uniref:Uncharacterized protein n=1 Tax=Talaromyces atroroseus TaxID=1441469 RepID=A0A225AZK1_TALAT|nr:hypothetical protein UA08_03594 [Talaromyces atroroseus]OKL61139.1 hypothetical protein UA08_03594 [Talaromyces atroroseus]